LGMISPLWILAPLLVLLLSLMACLSSSNSPASLPHPSSPAIQKFNGDPSLPVEHTTHYVLDADMPNLTLLMKMSMTQQTPEDCPSCPAEVSPPKVCPLCPAEVPSAQPQATPPREKPTMEMTRKD
jgi:hypothetical protein